jgi:hypothetical protein
MEDLSLKHEGPKRAYWPTKHARDPAMKARVMCKTENVLLFEGQHDDSREVDAETGVEDGRRDCCSSVSGSGLYDASPVSTSAWDPLIFVVGRDYGGPEQRSRYEGVFQKRLD